LRAAPDGSELAATLLAFLDAGGDAARAAAELHVHRATLYRRLRRVEELAEVDLADGRARLELHNGLLLARLRG
jgi:DNA-binding PucR family transcriptional regulator